VIENVGKSRGFFYHILQVRFIESARCEKLCARTWKNEARMFSLASAIQNG